MLTQIPWSTFLVTIALLLALYYAIVITLFYKREVILLFSGGRQHSSASENSEIASSLQQELYPIAAQPENVRHLMDEVSALIEQATYSRFSESQTKEALQKLISAERFQSTQESGHSAAINEWIIRECKTNCSMHLNEEDLQRLWEVSVRD